MLRESYAYKRMSSAEKVGSEKYIQSQQRPIINGVGLPIPAQSRMRRQSTNESDDSNDSLGHGESSDRLGSPVTAFSRSLSSSHGGHPFNVYSVSPRSTSVMYQYYSTPKGFYQNQVSLAHSARGNGHYRTDECASSRLRYRNFVRTHSECCYESAATTSLSPSIAGIPETVHDDVVKDPRRRAWSESDSSRRNSISMSRMSALRKLKKKLGRSGSFRKRRDDNYTTSSNHSHSTANMNSLEKLEEGRQLCMSAGSTSISNQVTLIKEPDLCSLSLHEENETAKPRNSSLGRNSSSSSSRERIRTPSTESVFHQDVELIYQRFLEEHTCYDIMPTSCKLIVFDTRLQARKAFHALIENSVRAAPLWDSGISCYVGMLTVTDFINVLLKTHKNNDQRVKSVEEQTIQSWRKLLNQQISFSSISPDDTLLHSLNILFNESFHGLPIMDERSGDIFHIIDHKRILRFLYLFMNELPKPAFMNRTMAELKIGRLENIPTVTKCDTILYALELLIDQKLSAIPVVDENDDVVDIFCKLDMISLAAQGLYHDLSMTMEIALAYRYTQIFEDDYSDAFDRLSSNVEGSEKQSKSTHARDLSSHLNEHSRRNEFSRGTSQSSSIRGHTVIRTKSDKPPTRQNETSFRSRSSSSDDQSASESNNAKQRVRHISFFNPLVKCKLTDRLQHVIDLMVTTDANLLVVVGQSNSHVAGVITVADVLNFIITPSGHTGIAHTSPAHVHKRSRHRYSSISSTTTSLPSVQDEPENPPLDDLNSMCGWHGNGLPKDFSHSKHSTSSETCANDSGYSSASKLLKDSGSILDEGKTNVMDSLNSNFRFLPRGIEMERA